MPHASRTDTLPWTVSARFLGSHFYDWSREWTVCSRASYTDTNLLNSRTSTGAHLSTTATFLADSPYVDSRLNLPTTVISSWRPLSSVSKVAVVKRLFNYNRLVSGDRRFCNICVLKVRLEAIFLFFFFREGFKFDVKEAGRENIVLENVFMKVEFDSIRGLLKVNLHSTVHLTPAFFFSQNT